MAMLKSVGLYFAVIASSVLATQEKRSWDHNISHCVLPQCPEHASYEVTNFIENWNGERWPTEVQFACWPGYTLVGSRVIQCYDGRWSDQTPQCVAAAHIPHNTYQQQFRPQQQQLGPQQQQLGPQQQQLGVPQQQPQPQQQQFEVPQQQLGVLQQQSRPQQQKLVAQQQQTFQPQPQQFEPQMQQVVPPTQGSTKPSEDLKPQLQQCMIQLKECSQQPEPTSQLLTSQQKPPPQKEQISETSTQKENNCNLPEKPKNGEYTALADKATSPGDMLKFTALTYTCQKGYDLWGTRIVTCSKGIWSDFFPSCELAVDEVMDKQGVDANDTSSCPLSCQLLTSAGAAGLTESKKSGPFIADCGKTSVRYIYHHSGVAGGRPALGPSKWGSELPWHVGIYDKTATPYNQICGGSIISKNLVISAAHCFWDDLEKQLPASQYAVGAGKGYRDWDHSYDTYRGQKLDVKEIKIPPRYQHNTANFQEDIALVTVMGEFNFNDYIRPVCLDFDFQLDTNQLKTGNLGKVGGWGLTSENGMPSPDLQFAELPYVGIETCLAENEPGFLSYITSDKFCAGHKNGTAVCRGDSGGGLAFPEDGDRKKRYFLRGIVSSAPKSGSDCNVYAWATFTHVLRHEHFITPLYTN